MEIKDLEPKQAKVNIEVKVKSIGSVREFQKFGKVGRVANCQVEDKSGSIKLTLWNDDIDKIREGDTLRITNGFVSEFQGEKQLSAGRFGKIEVIGE
ncbi:MAG: OB-fold nucleic acid binding domain-containing protein [Nanoarchaeota archaeon]|nr:OB-fold nucleic acid binding domain-containing protein [Nanoarchaeota archaeon]